MNTWISTPHRLGRWMLYLLVLIGLLSAMSLDEAQADSHKKARIKHTGVHKLDAVFGEVDSIHGRLDIAENKIRASRTDLKQAIAASTDAPLAKALADFKAQSGRNVVLKMEDGRPRLDTEKNTPPNVQASVDGINRAIQKLNSVVRELTGIGKDTKKLVKSAKNVANPAALPKMAKQTNMKPLAFAKVVKGNVQFTLDTPQRIVSLSTSASKTIQVVIQAFSKGAGLNKGKNKPG